MYSSPASFTFPKFPLQMVHFPQTPSLFPHVTFQSQGYFIRRDKAFRVCPPSVLGPGLVRGFLRAVQLQYLTRWEKQRRACGKSEGGLVEKKPKMQGRGGGVHNGLL